MRSFCASLLSCLLWFGSVALADDFYWVESAGGDFGTPEYWNPLGPPGPTDAAIFDLPDTYTVSLGQDYANQRLLVDNGQVGFDLAGYTYDLQYGGTDPSDAAVMVGQQPGYDPLLMLYGGGHLSADACTLGLVAGGSGSLVVAGPGTTWTNRGVFTIGAMGGAFASFQDGATVNSFADVYLGRQADETSSGWGLVDLWGQQGQASTWTIGDDSVYSSSLYVGDNGTGILNIGPYATLTMKDHVVDDYGNRSSGWVFLGLQPDATGSLYVSGEQAQFNVEHSPVVVGEAGFGDLHVLDGGQMWMGAGELWAAVQPGSYGWVEVAGSGAVLEEYSWFESVIGVGGDAVLDVYDGGAASFSHLIVGQNDQASGLVHLASSGTLSSGYTCLGDWAGSFGEAWIDQDAVWTVTGRMNVGREGQGDMEIWGGGKLNQTCADEFALVLGTEAAGEGGITVSDGGSRLDTAGELVIGQSGSGYMNVFSGGQVTARQAHLATVAGSQGSLTVHGDGAGFHTTSGGLLVGREGEGYLLVEEGGEVTLSGRLDVGEQPGAIGAADVGSNGSVQCDGVWLGSLGPQDSRPAAEGYLTIWGPGASLESSSQILVGRAGYGELLVYDTAALFTNKGDSPTGTSGVVGAMAGSTGLAVVNYAGWFQDGALAVGWFGNGTLNIEQGGIVESAEGFIARQPGSIGAVTLSGDCSTWNVAGSLAVGGTLYAAGGLGELNVNGANTFVRVGYGPDGGTLMVWDNGQVNLNGGRMAVGGDVFYGSGSLVVWENGTLAGNGTVTGTVHNRGTVSPGASPGTLHLDGDYVQDSPGSLKIEIAGLDQFDCLTITGQAALNGGLTVDLLGFTPGYDDTFIVLQAGQLTGAFSDFFFSQGAFEVIHDYALNQVVLTHYTPEPGALALFAVAGLVGLRKRKGRKIRR